MAGPIGYGVVAGIRSVTCPHCGRKNARGRHVTGQLTCKFCHKKFDLAAATARPVPRPRRRR